MPTEESSDLITQLTAAPALPRIGCQPRRNPCEVALPPTGGTSSGTPGSSSS